MHLGNIFLITGVTIYLRNYALTTENLGEKTNNRNSLTVVREASFCSVNNLNNSK